MTIRAISHFVTSSLFFAALPDPENPKMYCTTMLLNQLPSGKIASNIEYHLLSDDLPIDLQLRQDLHRKRLDIVLGQHQFERTDRTYRRDCLYCRDVGEPTRADFLEHLYTKHFLQLGKPENLVFIDELIEDVQSMMDRLVCLFCLKVFKDRATLKEHMRKKGHKRINPDNRAYDKYFLCNYKNEMKSGTGAGKAKQHQEYLQAMAGKVGPSKSTVFETPDGSDTDWSDWEGETENISCLYCKHTEISFVSLKKHMKQAHEVDFDNELEALTFYQRIKVVNYVRRQIYTHKCVTCTEQFDDSDALTKHLVEAKHFGIGDKKSWDQPEFFFPTYEDDAVLCYLDDSANVTTTGSSSSSVQEAPEDTSVVIISEDTYSAINLDAEALSKEFLKF